jgi:hypothetical protein
LGRTESNKLKRTKRKTIEFKVKAYNISDENYEYTVSGKVKILDDLKEMGFNEHDGTKRISTTGETIMTFNGRRCCPIKNSGRDEWFVLIIDSNL